MDDKSVELLEEYGLVSQQDDTNLLNLGDRTHEEGLMSLNKDPSHSDITDKNEFLGDSSDDLLNLGEPSILPNIGDKCVDETVAISKFAEEFVEPILKEVIARHKSEIEDETNELHNEGNVDKKSEKSSSDDGFEYVKGDDVIEEMHQDIDDKVNEGDEVKRELEDMVFQEQMHLEINENTNEAEVVKHESEDNVLQDEMHQEIEYKANEGEEVKQELEDMVFEEQMRLECSEKEMSPVIVDNYEIDAEGVKEEVKEVTEITKVELINTEVDDTFNDEAKNEELLQKEQDEVLMSMDNLLDSIIPSDFNEAEQSPDDEHNETTVHEEIEKKADSEATVAEHDIKGKCKDIISWTHPVSSAIAFAILMFIELGLMMEYSIISLVAYSGLLLMVASFIYKIAINFRLINTQSSIKCIMAFNKEDVEYCVDVTVSWIDYIHTEIKSIAYMESLTKNIKVFAMLWALTYIGQMFNLQSLIFTGSLLLFSLPVVYGKFKTEIDAILGNICGQISGTMNKIKSKCQRLVGGR